MIHRLVVSAEPLLPLSRLLDASATAGAGLGGVSLRSTPRGGGSERDHQDRGPGDRRARGPPALSSASAAGPGAFLTEPSN